MSIVCGASSTPLIVTIATVLLPAISGLIGVKIGGNNSRKQAGEILDAQFRLQQLQERLSKLEELYELIEQWKRVHISQAMVISSAMQGKITFDKALEMINSDERNQLNGSRMETLAELYFPQATSEMDCAVNALKDFDAVIDGYRQEWQEKGPKAKDCSGNLFAALRELSDAVDGYKSTLASCTKHFVDSQEEEPS